VTEYNKVTTWAVTDALRIYENGKLSGTIPLREYPHLLMALAKALRDAGTPHRSSPDHTPGGS
jgi:hypothetical protein